MPTAISRDYTFESAHFLPNVRDGHKCKNMHGHHYRMQVTLHRPEGPEVDDVGFVIDFWDLDAIVQPLHDIVDHHVLNEIPGLENPTAELIAKWFHSKIKPRLQEHSEQADTDIRLVSVTVWETPQCSATYTA